MFVTICYSTNSASNAIMKFVSQISRFVGQAYKFFSFHGNSLRLRVFRWMPLAATSNPVGNVYKFGAEFAFKSLSSVPVFVTQVADVDRLACCNVICRNQLAR